MSIFIPNLDDKQSYTKTQADRRFERRDADIVKLSPIGETGKVIYSNGLNWGATGVGNLQNGISYSDYPFWNNITSTWNIDNKQRVHIGSNAGESSQSTGAVAIGSGAGQTKQSIYSVAVGYEAGALIQNIGSVAIGYQSGQVDQSANCVSVGNKAQKTNAGQCAIAIGNESGSYNQGTNSVAIGCLAGFTSQNAQAVAIGDNAGRTNQGTGCIAIGALSGQSQQGIYSIAIGAGSGKLQNEGAVAIGLGSGSSFTTMQGRNSIAIGTNAAIDGQGTQSIAIGTLAGFNSGTAQPSNQIHICASSGVIGAKNQSNAFYVEPVRVSAVGNPLLYNSNNEIVVNTSSERYKKNISDLPLEVSNNLYSIEPKIFDRKDDSVIGEYGFISEQLHTVDSSLVNFDSEGRCEGVQYFRLMALMVKEIQNLKLRIDQLLPS